VLELGLGRGDVVDIRQFVARRPVILVTFSAGPPVILKWAWSATELNTDNELFWLRHLETALSGALTGCVPRILGVHPSGLLALDALTPAVTLSAALGRPAGVSAAEWARFAGTLAALHAIPVDHVLEREPDRVTPLPIPADLTITPQEVALGYGTDFREYVTAVQSVTDELTALRTSWRAKQLCHADLGPDNVLLAEQSGRDIRILDWEFAGAGDALYDIGTVLSTLVGRVDVTAGGWHGIRRDAALFFAAYREATGIGADEILRAVQYAGLSRLLSALGRLERLGTLGRSGYLALTIGRQMLRRPASVAESLALLGWQS
jgi:Ser/Thr protein kinase RdoA (MazF antagonist)